MGNAYVELVPNEEYYSKKWLEGTIEVDGGGALINQGIHRLIFTGFDGRKFHPFFGTSETASSSDWGRGFGRSYS